MSDVVENTIPVLPATDLRRSKDFYVQQLGFTIDWGEAEDATVCQVSRDDQRIMLMEGSNLGSPACVWLGCSAKLFDEFIGKGVPVLSGPENKPWAYQMRVTDVDGNILWLGADPHV